MKKLLATMLILVAVNASARLLEARPPARGDDQAIAKLIEQLPHSYAMRHKFDESVISQLAARGTDAIEPLLAAFRDPSRRPYEAFFRIFAEMKPSPARTLLEMYRRDTRPIQVKSALRHVLTMGGAGSEPMLIEMIKDSDAEIRKLAMSALYQDVTMTRAVKQLVLDAFKAGDKSVPPSLISHMFAADDATLPMLIDVLKKNSGKPRSRATITALGGMGMELAAGTDDLEKIVDALAWTLLNDPNLGARASAVMYLTRMGPKAKGAAAALQQTADHKNYDLRTAAQKALSKTGATLALAIRKAGGDDSIAELLSTLANEKSDASAASLAAQRKLARLGPKTFDTLMAGARLLGHSSKYRIGVSQLIAQWDDKIVDKLPRYVTDKNAILRRIVARAWGNMASINALPKNLDKLLHDENTMVRSAVVDSMVLWSKRPSPKLRKAVLPLLIDAMSDKGIAYAPRKKLYPRMAEMAPRNPEIISEMIRIMKTPGDELVRRLAATSLGAIGGDLPPERKELPHIVNAITSVLRNDGSSLTRWALNALHSIGAPAGSALPVLNRLSDTSDKILARLVKRAIERIKAVRR